MSKASFKHENDLETSLPLAGNLTQRGLNNSISCLNKTSLGFNTSRLQTKVPLAREASQKILKDKLSFDKEKGIKILAMKKAVAR
jgi:hypothetical protein